AQARRAQDPPERLLPLRAPPDLGVEHRRRGRREARQGMSPYLGIAIMCSGFASGALASLLAVRWPPLAIQLGHLGVLVGALAGGAVAFDALLDPGPALRIELPAVMPFAELSLRVDSLSALFLLVISLIGAAAAIYGPAYLEAHGEAH